MRSVLIVDDKDLMRDSVATTLERAGFAVAVATDGAAALASIASRRPDVVVTDMRMPGMTGLELVERVRALDDELPVIVMTAFGTIETAVKAMRLGAFDYLTKPFEGDELVIAVKRAAEHRRVTRENAVLHAGAAPLATGPRGLDRLVGQSDAMRRLRESLPAVAASHGTVLITGESGVGKEVVARCLHELSPRAAGSFLALNCAALSEGLLESELFGHERGSFTGADRLRKGRFELADGGTLLLDEVSEVSPKVQAKLLRVLQERGFERVGSSVTIGVDVRVVATSNRDLPQSCEQGEFRRDLYYRLNVLPVHIPPLRERPADIRPLAEHFVAAIAAREGRTGLTIEPGAMDLLAAYSWPGNVRELQNICERAVVLSGSSRTGGLISRGMLEPWLTHRATPLPPSQIEAKPAPAPPQTISDSGKLKALEDLEREAIIQALGLFNGHRQKTASALGIGVRTLGLKLKKWKQDGIVSPSL